MMDHITVKSVKMTDYNGITGLAPQKQNCHLNSEPICFLCLELLNQLSISDHSLSLRSIYRYLSVNGEAIILARLISELGEVGDTEKRIAKKMSSDSQTVVLCKQCASVIEPLIRLCMELELIQMRVHHYLQSVNGILECSQAIEDSTNHAELTRLMRKEMYQKCQIKLSQAVPKVMLTNDLSLLPENRIFNTKTSPETKYVEREFSPPPPLASDDESGGVDSDGEGETLQHDKMTKGSYETLRMKMKNPHTKHLPCNLCRPPRKVHILKRNQHDVLYHLDSWFISSKQSNVTQEQFKEYCFHVLKVELISCEKLSDGKGNVLAKCPHCPFSASTGNQMRSLRHHVAATHKKIISAKLEKLQRSTTVEELRTFQFPPGVAFSLSDEGGDIYHKKMFNCDACDKVFLGFASLNKHKIMEHMNGVPDKPDWTCQVCNKVFQTGLSLFRHRKNVHKMFSVMHKCQICGKEFNRFSRLSRHIKGVHENSLPIQKCNLCSKEFKYRECLLDHQKKIHGTTPRPVSECDICGKVFKRAGHDITKHKLREHNVTGFKCDQCEKSFTHSRSLSKHKRKKHQRQEARVDKLELSTAKKSDAETATATTPTQSQNGGQPIVLSKVEVLGDSETFERSQSIDHNDNCSGNNVKQEANLEESTNFNSDNEFDSHSEVPEGEMQILPD